MGRSSSTPFWWLWVMILVLLVNVQCCHCFGCLEQERVALLRIKTSINHPNGTSLPSWVDKETAPAADDCCQWKGVKCSGSNTTTTSSKRVIQLSLNNTRDESLGDWYFNASLFLPFEQLKTLHLLGNSLVGGWVENEEGFARLSNLEVLDLTYNHFNNSILTSLGGLSSLKFLYLRSNNLKGSVHFNKLDDFKNLKELDLTYNDIENFETISPAPHPAGGLEGTSILTNLEVLQLYGNQFNTSSFSSLSGLSRLKFLDLGDNRLKGTIRIRDLNGLSNLEELHMSQNEIDSFENPKGNRSSSRLKVLHLTNMKSNASNLLQSLGPAFPLLKTLYFESNNVEGTVTSQGLSNLGNLENLLLDQSSLNKKFLRSIGVLTSLEVLSLVDCGLNSTLPAQGWCELKNIQELYLSGNQLEGILPPCLGNLTSLRVIDLAKNQFAGNIATSPLSSLTSLEYLSISDNHFQVPLSFMSFANHSNLKVILCSNNKLVVEPIVNTWAPKFQLKVFAFANSTFTNLNVAPPNFLYYQYDLRILDLSHNNLSGTFPNWLLLNNTRLERLKLRHNSFRGPFKLPSLPNPNMLTIDISDNNIHGHIPANISSVFPNSEILNMSRNAFEGNPISLFNDMNNLWILDLSNNLLSGAMPEHLAIRCPSLEYFKLSNNNFYGQLLPIVFNLTYLNYLYLDGNYFEGKIPDGLSTISLLVLDVSNNQFSGELPRWIGNMTTIRVIAMSNNRLRGPIPVEFCKLHWLTFFDISENNLTGSIPSCFNPVLIEHIHLQKNRLQGPITRAICNCSFLVTLDLRDNYFSGNIPNWIGCLSRLSILLLKANQFIGEIPVQLCHLSKLSILDLSRNYLSSSIPTCLSNITSEPTSNISDIPSDYINTDVQVTLQSYVNAKKFSQLEVNSNPDYYQLMDVQVVVEFTTKWRSYSYKGDILNFISGVDLSSNCLTGEIPTEIGNFSKIRALNMSHNSLTGSIPASFSNLRLVESLDLSHNNLNGRIPPQLTELNYLAVFSVAHNNLSGTTPVRTAQFATFEEGSYEGNPLLCGPPLHINCSKTESPSLMPSPSDGKGEDSTFVDMGVFHVSFVVSYISVLLGIAAVLFINPHWRRAWFSLIEVCITASYYFIVDNFAKLRNFRKM